MARGEWKRTTGLIDALVEILKTEHPMTVRQNFYGAVSIGVIENCLGDYRRVSQALTKARDDHRVPYEWIVDRSRPTYEAATWANLAEYSDAVLHSYRLDAWQDQPNRIEVWCEKDAVTGSIQEVTDEFAVPLRALRGFNSTTNVRSISQVFKQITKARKSITVFYLGDWDPSGAEIERDVARRVTAFGVEFVLRRLAIHKADIKLFRLPPLKVKASDPRASAFLREHGKGAVELDALPPAELRRRLRTAIKSQIEPVAWQRAMALEQAQRETTERVAAALMRAGDAEP